MSILYILFIVIFSGLIVETTGWLKQTINIEKSSYKDIPIDFKCLHSSKHKSGTVYKLTPEELEVRIEQDAQDSHIILFQGKRVSCYFRTPMNTTLLLQKSTYMNLKHMVITNSSHIQKPIAKIIA